MGTVGGPLGPPWRLPWREFAAAVSKALVASRLVACWWLPWLEWERPRASWQQQPVVVVLVEAVVVA